MTNQVKYLREVDEIIVMENCEISGHGTYDQLIKENSRFAEFIKTHEKVDLSDTSSSSSSGGDTDSSDSNTCHNPPEAKPLLQRSKSRDNQAPSGVRKRRGARYERAVSREEVARQLNEKQTGEEEDYKQGTTVRHCSQEYNARLHLTDVMSHTVMQIPLVPLRT